MSGCKERGGDAMATQSPEMSLRWELQDDGDGDGKEQIVKEMKEEKEWTVEVEGESSSSSSSSQEGMEAEGLVGEDVEVCMRVILSSAVQLCYIQCTALKCTGYTGASFLMPVNHSVCQMSFRDYYGACSMPRLVGRRP